MESNLKRKREAWSDDDIKVLLEVIKENHILQLLDSKSKRNKVIYTTIEEELKTKNIFKSADQIRNKYKFLKSDYHKIKRNNNKSGAKKQTSLHFEILDELFGHRPMLTAVGVDTCSIENDNLTENLASILEDEELSTNEEIPVSCTIEMQEERHSTSQTNFTKKVAKKNSYEKVVESFSTQWKKTHEDTMKRLMERDEQNWERFAEFNRETARMLEKDRQETAKMLSSMLPMTSHTRPQYLFDGSYLNVIHGTPLSNNSMTSHSQNNSNPVSKQNSVVSSPLHNTSAPSTQSIWNMSPSSQNNSESTSKYMSENMDN